MKKIFLILLLLVTSMLSIIFIYSHFRRIEKEIKIFSILKEYAYLYEDNRRFSFSIYLNQEDYFIEYIEQNSYELKNENIVFTLNNVEVTKEFNCKENEEKFFQYRISADLLNPGDEELFIKDARLEIKNTQFSLQCLVGNMTVYPKNLPLLDVLDLYGNYTYLDDELQLIGIVTAMQYTGILNRVSIGSVEACLEYAEQDVLYDGERDYATLKHPPIMSKVQPHSIPLKAKSHYYFIPFSYEELKLITLAAICFVINGEKFILDTFSYYASPIYLINYPHLRQEGVIKNA